MVNYASGVPAADTDGLPYCTNKAMPGAEADLFNLASTFPDPVPVMYTQAILATVQFQVVGNIASNTSYVVLQTDLGDGVWVDVAWCTWTGTSGTAVFALSGGMDGANAFQQRTTAAPTPVNGSNQIPLGGRIRFVGKGTVNAGSSSSSSSGAVNQVQVTIKYKLLGLR